MFRAHLKSLGFSRTGAGELAPPQNSKECFRQLHAAQRRARLALECDFVRASWSKFEPLLANGWEVNPGKIRPRLELIHPATWQADLFRLVTLSWSVPISEGYGRRMRFLVWDDANWKLMGIFALGDPVFNLRVRDNYIGWSSSDRSERLVNVMDAYILGSVPPYNLLLGGKLIACLTCSRDVVDQFARKYADSKGVISKKRKHAVLAMVSTSSALGRSSIYNRLQLGGRKWFQSIGYTEGWGHFHISDELFGEIRRFLKTKRNKYSKNYRYGDGPNWRLRAVRAGLELAGLNSKLLRHNIGREVFVSELASNSVNFLRGDDLEPIFSGLMSVEEIGELARAKWLWPRAARVPEYQEWSTRQFLNLLVPESYKNAERNTHGQTPEKGSAWRSPTSTTKI